CARVPRQRGRLQLPRADRAMHGSACDASRRGAADGACGPDAGRATGGARSLRRRERRGAALKEATAMRARTLDNGTQRTWALIFDTGDEVLSPLLAFATRQQVTAARFSAIGAFREATLGYFDWASKQYEKIPVREQVEVLSLVGDVALEGDAPTVHEHVVVGKHPRSTRG